MSAIRQSKWQRIWQVLVSLYSEPNEGAFDWAQGLRGAVGISIPAVAGLVVDHLPWGILSAFATHWVLSCDVDGAYRQKAAALAGAGVTVLVAYIFGNWMVKSVANYIIGTKELKYEQNCSSY